MNPLEQLAGYLRRIERNLRLLTLARGFAILCGCALLITVFLVLWMSQLSFSDPSVYASRVLLFFALAAALSFALVFPLLRLNQRRAARLAERRHPELGDRLLTFVERRSSNDAFLPLLAADALPLTAGAAPDTIAAPAHAYAFGFLALSATLVLVWLGLHGPGFFGYGTSLLWGVSPESARPFYSVSVEPGSARVRRHNDQIITARLNGFFSQQATLFVRYQSATSWEQTAMRPHQGSAAFQYLLVSIPENLEYYVVSNGIHSATLRLTAVDLPQVTHLRVTYHFPAAYGRKDDVEDPGGDLRAIAGTVATLEIKTDKPLSSGFIVLDDGSKIELINGQARVPIKKDGTYHIATLDGGEMVRLTDDYFIEARPDSPPVVTILRPTRDARATPIEEVPVELQARDDNGILALDLHYSVNGGPEQSRSVLNTRGAKDAHGSSLLALEDFKLVPGDVVSLYATARDAITTARSDIYFIEARPFEFTYRQDQSSGSGSGSGDEQPKIAERQKEIIAATFNQLKSGKKEASESENAKYLAGVQSKLRDEAQSLSDRSKARQLSGGGAALQEFVKDMEAAIAVMGPAADQLKGQHWQDALSPEQKALQYLLRAEAIFRDIQIQISKGGGGGGQSGASRDLQGITNLELDTQKNQYESGSQSAEDERQKQADEALKKLEELARRQQELAKQQQSQQNFQQRWEQEMLRREAEQVRKKLEELARNQQSSQPQSSDSQPGQQSQQQGQQGQQTEQGQQGQQAQQGQQSASTQGSQQSSSSGRIPPGTKQALDQALQSLSEATRDMGDAASHNSQSQAERAADQLNRAQSAISQMRQKQTGTEMGGVMDQAKKLADRQQGFDERLRKNFGGGASGERSEQQNRQMSSQMSQEKQREIDDLHQLEHGMQQAARGMQNTQPDAAKKLRDAIGEMQQNELESRMKWTVDALNKGMGSYAVMREAPVTMALNQLKESLQGAAGSMNASGKTGDAQQAMRQALESTEKLHRDLESRGSSTQGSAGPVGPSGGTGGNAPDSASVTRSYDQTMREITRLQQSVRSDPATAKELQDVTRQLQGFDPRRFPSDPQRMAALEQKILAAVEQAELILRRNLDASNGNVRTTPEDSIPPGYSNAVAEYFRRLSH